jgi:hypothetical protein
MDGMFEDMFRGPATPAPKKPEYAIRLGEQTIVGPGWRGPDEVIDSFHAFGVTRVYGTLVYRNTPHSEWREA